MKMIAVLKKAKTHLERYGWQQYAKGFANERCCIIGAMDVAALEVVAKYEDADGVVREAINAVKDALGLHRATSLSIWNDDKEMTKERVLLALQSAIDAQSTTGVTAMECFACEDGRHEDCWDGKVNERGGEILCDCASKNHESK